jgi:UDP-2,3-diacylglucosamine pyrophosphatase LpxH
MPSLSSVRKHLDIAVVSDIHLGSFGSNAKLVNKYLRSIKPKKLILNGDIIDAWNIKFFFFPISHLETLRIIKDMAEEGVEVHYVTGNHDDFLRKFSNTSQGNLHLVDRLELEIDGEKVLIVHGDQFDHSVGGKARVFAVLGAQIYDYVLLMNRFTMMLQAWLKIKPSRYAKQLKTKVKETVSSIHNYEKPLMDHAIDGGFTHLICGHVHHPRITVYENEKGRLTYLNCGDWVEHNTSLEYANGKWTLLDHELQVGSSTVVKEIAMPDLSAESAAAMSSQTA